MRITAALRCAGGEVARDSNLADSSKALRFERRNGEKKLLPAPVFLWCLAVRTPSTQRRMARYHLPYPRAVKRHPFQADRSISAERRSGYESWQLTRHKLVKLLFPFASKRSAVLDEQSVATFLRFNFRTSAVISPGEVAL